MSPEATQPERKKTVNEYSLADLMALVHKAIDAESRVSLSDANRILGNIWTELLRRSSVMADLRLQNDAITGKLEDGGLFRKPQPLSQEDLETLAKNNLVLDENRTLREDAEFIRNQQELLAEKIQEG